MTRRAVFHVALLAVALAAVVVAPGAGVAAATCAPTTTSTGDPWPGGEWRTFGHDYANTRTQPLETTIGPAEARSLAPAWTFSSTEAGGDGDFTGTPIVADGCVYVGSNGGWVFAINADTGELVWKTQMPDGGGINSSLGLDGGRLFAAVSHASRNPCNGTECEGPYVIALDQATGAILWQSSWTRTDATTVDVIDDQPGADVYSSPVIFDGVVFEGVSGGSAELGDEADRYAFQGGFVLIDAVTGVVLKKTYTVHPPLQPDDEFAGAGVWSTPAIDPDAKVGFVGTANPFKPQGEHENANAVIKVDLDKTSATFGEVVDSYKGNVDEYVRGLSTLPCYDIPGNPPPYYPQGIGSCGDIDLDFGASPNIFTRDGVQFVGAGQKSGVYHAFDAATMGEQDGWTSLVGAPTSVGGIVGSTAYDGESIYGPVTVPGYVWSVGANDGGLNWIAPMLDGVHWGPPVTVANGVVYSLDFRGLLWGIDASTGLPATVIPLIGSPGVQPPAVTWGGVSVARNTVYATVGTAVAGGGGYVLAFRPSSGGGGGLPSLPQLPALPGLGNGAAVVAAPGAVVTTYLTPVAVVQADDPKLTFLNLDIAPHDVDHKPAAGEPPLFGQDPIGLGGTAPVDFFGPLVAGTVYDYYCSLHPGMFGKLFAV
ncbi:MAG: PQQ-binding-like beta-propeller repeat protein [Actinomycetota bacterium]